jgi:3-hydroxyacyl-CoA dehydrogenase
MKMAKGIGKVGVLSGVCFGFIGNRMLEPYLREVNMLLLEGALPEQIDKAIYDFGFAMGPCAVGDLAGIDVGYKVRQARSNLPDDERYYRISDLLAEMGRYGQKTGSGYYRYESGSRTPVPDPEVTELIERESERLGITRRDIDDQEIVDRCMCALINEGADILDEGIALRSLDVDVVYVTGYGFPAYRGGPMFYADALGAAEVHRTIRGFAERLGNEHGYWTPSPLLERLAEQGGSFGGLDG